MKNKIGNVDFCEAGKFDYINIEVSSIKKPDCIITSPYKTVIHGMKTKGAAGTREVSITLDSSVVNAIIIDHAKRYPNANIWNEVKKEIK